MEWLCGGSLQVVWEYSPSSLRGMKLVSCVCSCCLVFRLENAFFSSKLDVIFISICMWSNNWFICKMRSLSEKNMYVCVFFKSFRFSTPHSVYFTVIIVTAHELCTKTLLAVSPLPSRDTARWRGYISASLQPFNFKTHTGSQAAMIWV